MNALTNRFRSAVRICSGPLAIKKRLTAAWLEHLDGISADELPERLQLDFIELRKAMYIRRPQPMEPAPQASIRKMSAAEAGKHAATIIDLYSSLLKHLHATNSAETVEHSDNTANGSSTSEELVNNLN